MGEPCLPEGGQLAPGVLEHAGKSTSPRGELREGCRVDVVVGQRDGGGPETSLTTATRRGVRRYRRGQRVRHQCVALDRPLDRDEGPAGCPGLSAGRAARGDSPGPIPRGRGQGRPHPGSRPGRGLPDSDVPPVHLRWSARGARGREPARAVRRRWPAPVGRLGTVPRSTRDARPTTRPRSRLAPTESSVVGPAKDMATLAAITRMLSGSKPRRSLTRATTRKATALGEQDAERVRQPTAGQSHRQGESTVGGCRHVRSPRST